MIKTRCKMYVSRIVVQEDQTEIEMQAVGYECEAGEPPEENKAFFAFTPFGSFHAIVTNDSFAGAKEGDEFYIDLTLIEK